MPRRRTAAGPSPAPDGDEVLADTFLVPASSNRKTGRMPVTYRPMRTCEPTCAFLPTETSGGCCGTGRTFAMADRSAGPLTVSTAIDVLRRFAPAGACYLRDRAVGDLITDQARIDHTYIARIAAVGRAVGLTVFGYTHAWERMTRNDLDRIAATGYVLNASCESRDQAHTAVLLGMPVTITSDLVADGELIAGRRVITCPAQTRDDITCVTCGLCAKPDRKTIVRFRIHGRAWLRAAAAVEAAENRPARRDDPAA